MVRLRPLYRLLEGTGREHVAFGACHYREGDKQQTEYIPTDARGQPVSNAQALANYTERYVYDDGGNLTEIRHLRNGTTRWFRTQTYGGASNRIMRSEAGCEGEGVDLSHDANGNVLNLAHLPQIDWSERNQLIGAQLNVAALNPDYAHYQYDSTGQRIRKLLKRGSRIEERIYLGSFELFLVRDSSGPLERWEILHVADGQRRIGLIETKTAAASPSPLLEKLIRLQLGNHLGSAVLEIDDSTAARIISYEEFSPYGQSTYIAGQTLSEVRRKRYRYTGVERDNETGLYYCGDRYLAPWIGRWMSCDSQLKDGCNLYRFARNGPLNYVDRAGTASWDPEVENIGKIEQLKQEQKGHQAAAEALEEKIKKQPDAIKEAERDLEFAKGVKDDLEKGHLGGTPEEVAEQIGKAEEEIKTRQKVVDSLEGELGVAEEEWKGHQRELQKIKARIRGAGKSLRGEGSRAEENGGSSRAEESGGGSRPQKAGGDLHPQASGRSRSADRRRFRS